MALIVQKFGGSSLADVDRIRTVARRIVSVRRGGRQVVAVVSAMGSTTDRLLQLARRVSSRPAARELDMLLSAGERQTMALLSLAIMDLGYEAVSFTGSQVGIITDEFHTEARIRQIRGDRLRAALRGRKIPIVAGFQGVSREREITTLGRGGSDITAVAIAAVLRADRCELFKDVSGIFTENPAEFDGVRPVRQIGYDELAELAGSGSEVIQPRACALAAKYRVPLVIRPTFSSERGTMVTETECIERAFVRALTHRHEVCRLTLTGVVKKKRCLHQVVTRLAEARIPVLLFNHGVTHGDRFDLSYVVAGEHAERARAVLEPLAKSLGAAGIEIKDSLASVSVVGPGVGSDPEVLSETLATLHAAGIHLDAFTAAETSITAFVDRADLKVAAAALLARFRLTKQ